MQRCVADRAYREAMGIHPHFYTERVQRGGLLGLLGEWTLACKCGRRLDGKLDLEHSDWADYESQRTDPAYRATLPA